MTKKIRLGIIGLGEVGFAMATGLKEQGLKNIAIYDVLLIKDPGNELLNNRVKSAGLKFYGDLEQLVKQSDILLSVTNADVAVSVAKEVSYYLKEQHLYVDLNSSAPSVQEEIDKVLKGSSCKVVDAAIMGAISMKGYKTPIVAAGNGRYLFRDIFTPFGMNINADLVEEMGQASALKMYRSVFAKGIEVLLIEMLVAAEKYGVKDQVFDLVCNWMDGQDKFSKLAETLVKTHAIHAGRRSIEMGHVSKTVRQVGVDPIMSEATMKVMKQTEASGIKEHFSGNLPADYQDVIDYLVSVSS